MQVQALTFIVIGNKDVGFEFHPGPFSLIFSMLREVIAC
jgi:hypothetical protein